MLMVISTIWKFFFFNFVLVLAPIWQNTVTEDNRKWSYFGVADEFYVRKFLRTISRQTVATFNSKEILTLAVQVILI